MTASTLLLYISLFLGSQALLGLAFTLLRKRSEAVAGMLDDKEQQPRRQLSAWSGVRTFRVARRARHS